MKRYTVELTEKEWRMIRLALANEAIKLERTGSQKADEYDALVDKLYDGDNYTVIE